MIENVFGSSNKNRVKDLKEQLKTYEKSYDRCITQEIYKISLIIQEDAAQIKSIVTTETERSQLDRLLKAVVSNVDFDSDKGCLDGTREDILKSIYDWIDKFNSNKLFWLYGIAGSGKSTISHTVAKHLKKTIFLVVVFFAREIIISSIILEEFYQHLLITLLL